MAKRDLLRMLWIVGVLIIAMVVVVVLLSRTTLLAEPTAREYLRKGARVVDVRTESEFRHKHVPGALHLPLNELREKSSSQLPEKSELLLLYCAAGGRSAIARRILRQMGYVNVHNLGSCSRAERLVQGAKEPESSAPGNAPPALPA
jgi:phage shock protein E